MFGYALALATRNLRRSPGLTALMVLAVGVGVAASMTMVAVVRGLSADPIPDRSSQLFVPQIDIWGSHSPTADGEPQLALDYTDVTTLMRQHRASRQSALYAISASVTPAAATGDSAPIAVSGYAVGGEFFPMLEVPFRFGSGWPAEDDARDAPVAVISDRLNRQVFGGANSVGRSLEIDHRRYRIAGVIRDWNPRPYFFDVTDLDFHLTGPDVFVPFGYAVANGIANDSVDQCPKGGDDPGTDFARLLRSDCAWISYLVELDDPAAVRRYREYLDAYAAGQRELGRFAWAPNNRLRDIPAFLAHAHVVPGDTRVSLLVAHGLLVVCLLNTLGLLLTKFLRRGSEVAVRRAMGASRRAIWVQLLAEAGLIGLAGGGVGLLLTVLGVHGAGAFMPASLAAAARIDPALLSSTVLLAVVATLLASVYPAYRALRVPPAWLLKAH